MTTHHESPDHDYSPQTNVSHDEAEALHHYRLNLGLNYDAGFGSFLGDTAAGDLDQTFSEHQPPHD